MSTLQEALIKLGVAQDDLDALMTWPAYKGMGLAERVYRSGLVSDHRLVEAFGALGATDGTAQVLAGTPPPAALGAFSRNLAEKHRALPLAIVGRRVIVALLDPSDTAILEKLSFTCGLIVEPRACRARVLFEALHKAYDAAVVRPEHAFLASRKPTRGPAGEDMGFELPPPSTDAAARAFATKATADERTSPMARVLVEAAAIGAGAGIDIALDDDDEPASPLLPRRATDLRPASSPRLSEDALRAIAAMRPSDLRGARDSLPPMVLRLLVPPLRTCALFVVKKNIAVGWDVLTAEVAGRPGRGIVTADFRDVLVPLTADSVLSSAFHSARASLGRVRDPTTMERTLFRFMRLPPPRSFAALPVLVGDEVMALLYGDRDDGSVDDGVLDDMRRVGSALGDALAPLSAAQVW